MMNILNPPEEKLEPPECHNYESWANIRKLNIKDKFILSYVTKQRMRLEQAKILYKQILFFTLLGLTKITFDSGNQEISYINLRYTCVKNI